MEEQSQQLSAAPTPAPAPLPESREVIDQLVDIVIKSYGGRRFQVPADISNQDRISQIISSLENKQYVTGCKIYENSLNKDKVVDESVKTIVMTTFINTAFIKTIENSRDVLVTQQFKEALNQFFTGYQHKVLVFKSIKKDENGQLPRWVPKWVNKNHVLVKVVIKIPK